LSVTRAEVALDGWSGPAVCFSSVELVEVVGRSLCRACHSMAALEGLLLRSC
jgi:hypothetical protein